jgi:hypothetical protein
MVAMLEAVDTELHRLMGGDTRAVVSGYFDAIAMRHLDER